MMFTLMISLAVAGLALFLSAVAVREPGFATVDPFDAPPAIDPGAETIANGSADPTLAGDWQRVELTNLSEAEDLLDHLEMIQARDRSLEIAGNSTFVIRWR